MGTRAAKTRFANFTPTGSQGGIRAEQLNVDISKSSQCQSQTTSTESIVKPSNGEDSMFTHAPVSLWEEDFSEVKKRFDQFRRSGVEDLRKHFKKHPEEVLSLARMVRVVRVNNETLTLFDAAGTDEFLDGLSKIFNSDSFDVFKEELLAFWRGRTSFASEAINLTLTGTIKNILIHALIPPGFEQTWVKVYVAITDITAINDRTRNLATSEQKYRSVFNAVQTAVLLADASSGMIIEANRNAKRLFGSSNVELAGQHLADLVRRDDRDRVRELLRQHPGKSGFAGQVIHVRHKSDGTISVVANVNTIESGDTEVYVVSLTRPYQTTPTKSIESIRAAFDAGPGKKLTKREREILTHVCQGKTSRAIAQHLCISEKTVETHRARIMQKLDTSCVVDLVKFAMANGLVQSH